MLMPIHQLIEWKMENLRYYGGLGRVDVDIDHEDHNSPKKHSISHRHKLTWPGDRVEHSEYVNCW